MSIFDAIVEFVSGPLLVRAGSHGPGAPGPWALTGSILRRCPTFIRSDDWPWSSYNNFALNPVNVRDCPIQFDNVRLTGQYRG